ncbi:phosphatase PAP2 family protein [Rummeliibacillus pycnus]|uniref:phosphatase PAP2 family protein n=1 Tax=Rummeliibacillus pycnus TaxID=101070 RepID=UPI000C9A2297|nr:phosphatase PAP2 family protein [Rummeliibacillus pycnus]
MTKFFYFLAIVTAVIFFILDFSLNSTWVTSLDIKASTLLKGNSFIEFFHYFGETKFILIVAVCLLVWLWIRNHNYRGMMFALLTIAGGNVFNQILKEWIRRPRPVIPHQLSSFSFPSGHAMVGILYLFTITFLVTEHSSSKTMKLFAWLFATIMTALIGLSRIAGSHHFASDVIAGWSIGYTWFILCVIWYKHRKKL